MRSSIIALDILAILSDNKRHTIMEIADKIEVCYNTVQRHLIDLSIKYPIKVTTGGRDSAGVQLQKSSCDLNKLLSYKELTLLMNSLSFLPISKESEILKLKLEAYLVSSKIILHADTTAISSAKGEYSGQTM